MYGDSSLELRLSAYLTVGSLTYSVVILMLKKVEYVFFADFLFKASLNHFFLKVLGSLLAL